MTCENSNMWWKCVIVRLTEVINHSLTCVCRKKPWVTGPVRWWTERKRTYRNCRSASWSISPCRSTSAYKTWKHHRLIIGSVLVLLSHKGFSLKRCLKQNCRLCTNYPDSGVFWLIVLAFTLISTVFTAVEIFKTIWWTFEHLSNSFKGARTDKGR